MFQKKVTLLVLGSLLSLIPLHADMEVAETQGLAKESPEASMASFTAFTGKVRGNKVRMRAHSSLESAVVRETSTGEMFAIVGQEKDFYLVQPPKGSKGYVFRTFILDNVVEGDRVNIRLHPDIESPVIGQLASGEKVNATICQSNNKWLEIQLPKTAHFYIAKEYIENVAPIDLITKIEERKEQGYHLLNAAFHFATAEIQKPFDEIDINQIHQKFASLTHDFSDLPEIVAKAKESDNTIEETYVQKKIAFLESKADRTMAAREIDPSLMQRLSQIGSDIKGNENFGEIGTSASSTLGTASVKNDASITDKMKVWQAYEESLYHLWASTHDGKSMDDFYLEEADNASILTGIVEPFNRPVKNRPGDYVLRAGSFPAAFLYSTRVNLQELVGKKVTLVSLARPNNNFAFPAYFVLSVE